MPQPDDGRATEDQGEGLEDLRESSRVILREDHAEPRDDREDRGGIGLVAVDEHQEKCSKFHVRIALGLVIGPSIDSIHDADSLTDEDGDDFFGTIPTSIMRRTM